MSQIGSVILFIQIVGSNTVDLSRKAQVDMIRWISFPAIVHFTMAYVTVGATVDGTGPPFGMVEN